MNILKKIQPNLHIEWKAPRLWVVAPSIALVAFGCVGAYWLLSSKTTPAPPTKVLARSTPKIPKVDASDLLRGQWSYLPGAQKATSGLTMQPEAFAIVKQDGSAGQSNTPVNLFGTHLEGVSDFTITAHLSTVHGKVGMQLYGQVPIIADEFRVGRPSLRLELDSNKLNISLWSGSQQTPTLTQSFTATVDAKPQLTVTHSGNQLSVAIGGQTLTTFSDSGVFKDGMVWFGFDASDGTFALDALNAKGVNGKTFRTVDSSTMQVSSVGGDALQALASKKRSDFTIGAAMALAPAVSDAAYAQTAFGGNFGALTPENAMKWQFTEPQKGVFDFKEGDALVALAKRHNMKVQGHTLVFAEANPRWVREVPKDQLEQVMTNHIKEVVGHYKGQVASWDVVNEPFDDDEWDQLRPHLWYQAMGQGYIAKAFTAARQADPNALLFMNEYGIEEDGDRWDALLALVTKLKQQGVPIDGVGFQAHVYESGDKISASVLRKHIQQLAAIGVKARVSEMDVYDEDGTAVQSQQFSTILKACLDEPNCISWTTWGVSDRYDYFIDDDGSIQQGHDFLWDENMKPTPAVTALLQVLR